MNLKNLQNSNSKNKKSELLIYLLKKLIALCSNEYDLIRKKSLQVFSGLSSRYGKHILNELNPCFSVLTTNDITFYSATGALNIISVDTCMKFVTRKIEGTKSFIKMIIDFPGLLNNIVEQDKKRVLMSKLAGLFVKYVEKWVHFPLTTGGDNGSSSGGGNGGGDIAVVDEIYSMLLKCVGYDGSGKLIEAYVIVNTVEGGWCLFLWICVCVHGFICVSVYMCLYNLFISWIWECMYICMHI